LTKIPEKKFLLKGLAQAGHKGALVEKSVSSTYGIWKEATLGTYLCHCEQEIIRHIKSGSGQVDRLMVERFYKIQSFRHLAIHLHHGHPQTKHASSQFLNRPT